jgi:hypothetical protein
MGAMLIFVRNGLIIGAGRMRCYVGYEKCTVGSSYETADKVCTCGADGLLKCAWWNL